MLRSPLVPEIHFQRKPGWGIGLDARAGVGMVGRSDARGSFAFAGALLRAHVSYFELGAYYERMRPALYACAEARQALVRSFLPDIPWPFTGLKLVVPPMNTLAFATLPRWARRLYGAPGIAVTDVGATVTIRALHQAATRIPRQLLGMPPVA